ncbi:FAD/NAD(P)-binding protein [Salinimonas iocasae]|uniref:FAD-dependent urate hydroxylase HpyO/Asp monooxygenase CreE-like FAD/NAD(P)-binding domain-containing protein n=1 Tax=Salinimonas iocasae TaxID=2572577 RepID=A0A5B7YEE1_9ALTE|nr:FAD/NAD(P)-binding protein [Salinimonas iocasae]QCZ93905.1 hypothetical protein FBQ74_10585 [Salinimonas iocasae]
MSARHILAIVGAGPTTLMFLNELLQLTTALLRNLDITVFEASDSPGRGFAFGDDAIHPCLLSNNTPDEIPVLTMPFSQWYRQENRKPEKAEDVHSNVVTRAAIGAYFSFSYKVIFQKLIERGLAIRHEKNTVVENLKRCTQGIQLSLNSGNSEYFEKVFINYGKERSDGTLNNTLLPYPVARYANASLKTYNVIGTSLTGIDCVTGIAHTRGAFTYHNNKLVYDSPEKWTVNLFSSHGTFPRIWYSSHYKGFLSRYFTRHANPTYYCFDNAYRHLFLGALQRFAPGVFCQVKTLSFKEALDFMAGDEHGVDPWQKLHIELFSGQLSPYSDYALWPVLLEAFLEAIETIQIVVQDHSPATREVKRLIAFHTAAIPVHSCEKLQALHRAGRLSIRAKKIRSEDIVHDKSPDTVFIDARGNLPPINNCLNTDKIAKALGIASMDKAKLCREQAYEIVANGEASAIHLGSAYLIPDKLNTPGLDTCQDMAKSQFLHIKNWLAKPAVITHINKIPTAT